MGTLLAALLNLQSIERRLGQVRSRLATRKNAVQSQQKRIEDLRKQQSVLQEKTLTRRKDADRMDLDLKSKEEQISKLRTQLHSAKTNKEYAAILTQINTYKADNAKIEEEALKIMQEVDAVKAEGEKLNEQIATEEARLAEINKINEQEIVRLAAMHDELAGQRAEAAKAVPEKALAVFERIASNYDGEAMAVIEIHGKRPPHEYICGGCFMSLNAEHANALRSRDEIRNCDNCGRILYLEPQVESAATD
jgi:predicted  nucleic acid-binding Zn-ribbon protein